MARFNVPAGVRVKDFFKNHVPGQFRAIAAGSDPSAMAGKQFTLQFNVDDQRYCLKMKNGKDLEIVEGGIEKPMLALTMSEANWRETVSGEAEGVIDRFIDPTQIADSGRYNKLLSTKGTLNVELTREDGTTLPMAVIFNGEAKPSVTIKLKLGEWVAMQRKEVVGQTLFLTGKMKVTGDMMFLMTLQALL